MLHAWRHEYAVNNNIPPNRTFSRATVFEPFAKISSKTWDLAHIWRTGKFHDPRLETWIYCKQ